MGVTIERGVYSAAVAVAGAGLVIVVPNQAWVGWTLVTLGVLLLLWGFRLNGSPVWRKPALTPANSEHQSQSSKSAGGEGAKRGATGLEAGGGGDAQFWGGGGGGGGGISVAPDGSILAGGGGGGGGLSPGGRGGGPLGGGGGGSVGLPPEFLNAPSGQILTLLWRLKQDYISEKGKDVEVLPEDWANDKLRGIGSNLKYSIQDGHMTFNRRMSFPDC